MLRIFCLFGWHTWESEKGNRRKCKHCGKTQVWIRVGDDAGWH